MSWNYKLQSKGFVIFVEDDISGEVVRLGDSRLLLLPNDFESVKGPERGHSAYY